MSTITEPIMIKNIGEKAKVRKTANTVLDLAACPKYQKSTSKSHLKPSLKKGLSSGAKKSKRALKNPPLAKKMAITISKNNEIIYW
mmetsp:Transcript_38902/g.38489  ORF Transcript_38902/g.38489 Transcript_38902/m.38489 type:complete len:86 (+) Transcript_38902:1105-1362(+)